MSKSKKLRKDKQERVEKLCKIVEKLLVTEGQENLGKVWVLKSRKEWADLMGVSEKTITALHKNYPIDGVVFLVQNEEGQRVKCLGLRLLQEGEFPVRKAREMAGVMRAIFRKSTNHKVSKEQFGMLNGLAVALPDNYQVTIFKWLVTEDGWASFMAALDQFIYVQNEMLKKGYEKRFYRYPSIPVMRRFPLVAAEAYKSYAQHNKKPNDYNYIYDMWLSSEELEEFMALEE